MKTKFSRILIAVLILTVALGVLAACNTPEQSLDGLYIVTFRFNGGVLYTGAANVFEQIQHAYNPNSYVIDVSQKYEFIKTGYVFDGWYTKDGSESGDWGKQWNFSSDRITEEAVTLYAKWETEIVYSYTLYYVDEQGKEVSFGTYRVAEGAKFKDEYNYTASALGSTHGRTYLNDGFYQDKELTTPWNDEYTHPGGEESVDIRVYVRSIPGLWKIVTNFQELIAAGNSDIWLMNDVNCQGQTLSLGERGDYSGKLQGNGHEISNFTVKNVNSNSRDVRVAIFRNLGENARIENVKFTDAHFVITAAKDTTQISVAALAISASDGCVISNVTVSGTYTADLSATGNQNVQNALNTIPQNINKAFATENSTVNLATFTVNVTKQD